MFQFRNLRHSAPVPATHSPDQRLVRTGSREAGPLLADTSVRKSTTRGPVRFGSEPCQYWPGCSPRGCGGGTRRSSRVPASTERRRLVVGAPASSGCRNKNQTENGVEK
ncbi:hypothetical protein CUJ89_28065 [Burkholderia pyrrocinia]|uniref:Uncharacterized protein n=1 Tax=Burkholderia pyrrocinia TaxID=60550 RepID=A0A2Z5N6M0_BURPY|nr:hypothetical protein CUJ89_28065 [Burkholderia pyrrocinia]